MGDLIGTAVEGALHYIARGEFERVARLNADPLDRIAVYADMARLNALYMIANAGSGHIGSSFSTMDVAVHLYRKGMGPDDIYFSSKGHDAPGLYAVLIAEGVLAEANLHKLRRIDGLPGHPDVSVPGMRANTGSLGQGISKAKGMAFANRQLGKKGRIFVVTGDGELQEGQIWESLVSAANHGLDELTVIVDHNKIQSDYSVERTSSLGDLPAKFAAFGWRVERIDGHDLRAFDAALARLPESKGKPTVIIADTIKGKGVSFMEGVAIDSDVEMFKFHSGAPQAADYVRAAQELIDRINAGLARLETSPLLLETVERKAAPAASGAEPSRLFPAYTAALLAQAERNQRIVALDADLVLDMGLVPFTQRHPERFVECGIAEMDMVSQAGGMALNGLLPVVHSFSCFLAPRANEQIYTNATERTKIVYVGGLSGVLPGGPGHSHQSVRDISAVGGVPGMAMVEPCHPDEVAPLLDWCLNAHDGPSFLRMVSIPYVLPFSLPADYTPTPGQGVALTDGADALLTTYGPVMTSEAVKAAALLAEQGVGLKVVNLPWLNRVDGAWLAQALGSRRHLVTLDNHYVDGGQGDRVLAALALAGALGGVTCQRLGLTDVPPSGTNDEVLQAVALDAASLARRIAAALGR